MDLYYLPGSAPCRAVQMAATAMGIPLNYKLTNVMAGEHMTPEYLKMNPQHYIPTLVDNGFALWESRAITVYLAEKFGKDNFYPKDLKKRATINQRLNFDLGTLYLAFSEYYFPQLFKKLPGDPEKLKKVESAMELFDTFLKDSKYAAGNEITLADFSLVASVSTFVGLGYDISKYPNVAKWFELCKETVPGYSLNQAGVDEFVTFFKNK